MDCFPYYPVSIPSQIIAFLVSLSARRLHVATLVEIISGPLELSFNPSLIDFRDGSLILGNLKSIYKLGGLDVRGEVGQNNSRNNLCF
jgi:hypothetical protein